MNTTLARSPTAPRWEAILHAHENPREPGHWHMHYDVTDDPYACVRLLTVELDGAPVKRYRVVTWRRAKTDRELVGYFATLKRACEEGRRQRQAEVSQTQRRVHPNGGIGSAYG